MKPRFYSKEIEIKIDQTPKRVEAKDLGPIFYFAQVNLQSRNISGKMKLKPIKSWSVGLKRAGVVMVSLLKSETDAKKLCLCLAAKFPELLEVESAEAWKAKAPAWVRLWCWWIHKTKKFEEPVQERWEMEAAKRDREKAANA